MNPRRASLHRAVARCALLGVALTVTAGCGDERRYEREANGGGADTAADASRLLGDVPHASSIRFQETRGTGLSRESWDVEVLQTGPDVWVVGSLRAKGNSLPVKESMPLEEYHELWSWLRGLSLDGIRAVEDSSAAPEGWTKTLKIDIVESGNRRVRGRTSWARPLTGQPELLELEKRLHDRLIAASERELVRMRGELKGDSTNTAEARASADSARAGLPPLIELKTE